jgi:hypothetical protein
MRPVLELLAYLTERRVRDGRGETVVGSIPEMLRSSTTTTLRILWSVVVSLWITSARTFATRA